jgi:hypothetical protein
MERYHILFVLQPDEPSHALGNPQYLSSLETYNHFGYGRFSTDANPATALALDKRDADRAACISYNHPRWKRRIRRVKPRGYVEWEVG